MAKTKISEYNATASSNTDIDGINLAEGMAPSLINNSIRELMAHLKDFQSGSSSDTLTLNGKLTVGASAELTGGLSVAGQFVSTGEFSPSAVTTPLLTATGGTLNNVVIGNSSPNAGTFSIITATTKINGPVSADSIVGTTISAGNVFGTFHGTYSGDLTGNVTATSGTSQFTHLIVNGTLNMDSSTTATITNLSTPINDGDAATKGYVDSEIAGLVDSAPGTLDTLNELAAALDDDPNFAASVASSIGTKLALTGGSVTGVINMGGNTIDNVGSASTVSQVVNKGQMETQDALKLSLSGGTMAADIAMGGNRITGLNETPTASSHATSKAYVDGILTSGTNAASAAASATVAAASAQLSALAAASSQVVATTQASNALNSASAAEAHLDSFQDIYLGSASSDPSTDLDGDSLTDGTLYFNTTQNKLKVFSGSSFNDAAFDVGTAVTSFAIQGGAAQTGAVTLTTANVTTLASTTFEPKGESTTQAVAMALVFGG
jgi:hypothetical protein